MKLCQIEATVAARTAQLASEREWPCRRGCDDCCRSLPTGEPVVSRAEWDRLRPALLGLEDRIRQRDPASRTCPLLDSGVCLVYEARPIACRSYGFYADRGKVLGCHRIEALAAAAPGIVWGNQASLERELDQELGAARPLSAWLAGMIASGKDADAERVPEHDGGGARAARPAEHRADSGR